MKLPISTEQIYDIVARVRATGVPYLVVGGQAVRSASVNSETEDVDLIVAVRDFDTLIHRLEKDSRFAAPDRTSWVAKYELHFGPRRDDYVELDLLNGRRFCGDRTPDEFFDYLARSWAIPSDLGPCARIPAVWYTRLMVRDSGLVYVRKVVRDLRAGASPSDLDDVLRIGQFCGTRKEVAGRIAQVREILGEVEGGPDARRE